MTPLFDAFTGLCPCVSHVDLVVTFVLGAVCAYVLTATLRAAR